MVSIMEKGTVLLVDDEQLVLSVGTMMLKKLGYGVSQAKSGREAIQIFKDNMDGFCLVLLDINMPGENGSDTCRRLKGIKPDVKVIHTSGMGMCQAGQLMECGCKGFMSKPFGIEELSKKLQESLELQSE
jgi:CheY-like chemotaxis protein